MLCCLGDFEGCDLVFPRYKVAVRYREGDILLADVANEVHGNTPLLNPDGTVPELGEEPERLTCVFYYEEKMHHCLNSTEEEMEFINNRKKGDPIFPNKKRKEAMSKTLVMILGAGATGKTTLSRALAGKDAQRAQT